MVCLISCLFSSVFFTSRRVKTMFYVLVSSTSVFILFMYLLLDFEYFTTQFLTRFASLVWFSSKSYVILASTDGMAQNDVKSFNTILLWTKHFGSEEWFPPGVLESGPSTGPNEHPCLITNDRDYLEDSDAVVFNWKDIKEHDIPAYKYPNQVWVIVNHEAASNTKNDQFPKAAKGDFDWVVSYRRESDIYAPYGKIIPRTVRHPKWTMDREKFINITKKSKTIAWLVNECHSPSKREYFVKELKKYIHVDVFGFCGDQYLENNDTDVFMSDIEANYKFYLSLENSICKDYVTEKLFKTLQYDLIPVVLGGADYKDILPPNSYIDVSEFDCPYELASYLKWVGEDHQKYTSYLVWKENYTVWDAGYSWIFDVCRNLHRGSPQRHLNDGNSKGISEEFAQRWKNDLLDWWFEKSNCREWKLPENCTEEYYEKTYGYSLRIY